jgi:hypothetical protein
MTDTRATREAERRLEPEPTREIDREPSRDLAPEPARDPVAPSEQRLGTEAIARAAESPPATHRGSKPGNGSTGLFDEAATSQLRSRWTEVQSGFVDDPQVAVKSADELVAEVMKQLADGFARERRGLEDQWSRGDDVSTEDLRIALQRYRSFFDRLLQA